MKFAALLVAILIARSVDATHLGGSSVQHRSQDVSAAFECVRIHVCVTALDFESVKLKLEWKMD